MTNGTPTLEDLQSQISALSEKNSQLELDLEKFKGEAETTSESLAKARELNTKLLEKVAVNQPIDNTNNPSKQDSFEALVQEFIDKEIEKRNKNGNSYRH